MLSKLVANLRVPPYSSLPVATGVGVGSALVGVGTNGTGVGVAGTIGAAVGIGVAVGSPAAQANEKANRAAMATIRYLRLEWLPLLPVMFLPPPCSNFPISQHSNSRGSTPALAKYASGPNYLFVYVGDDLYLYQKARGWKDDNSQEANPRSWNAWGVLDELTTYLKELVRVLGLG